MTDSATNSAVAALRAAWATVELQGRALAERAADRLRSDQHRPLRHLVRPHARWARPCAIGFGVVAFAGIGGCAVLWWLLATGPIPVGFATSWLTKAIEQRLGGGHRVEVGGTVLERDEVGRIALRLRDVVVRDSTGAVVASAPKAEVGVTGLLTGSLEAERLSLIGAEMALRVEPDGRVTIFAGADKPSLASAPAASAPPLNGSRNAAVAPSTNASGRTVPVEVATDPLAALRWIERSRDHVCDYGRWRVEAEGAGRATIHMTDEYVWIDSAHRGGCEGLLEACGVTGEVTAELDDRFHGRLRVRWARG